MANTNSLLKCLTFSSVVFLASCSSVSTIEKRVASMEDIDRPSWATQMKAATTKDGKLMILGFQELDGDARISAAFRLSDNAVRTELSKLIQNQFSSITQSLEEGVSDDGSLIRFYSSEVSKNVLRDIRITSRYWEKMSIRDADGEPTIKLRVYSLGEIPEAKLKKMVRETLEKSNVDPEIKKQIQSQFESEIKQFSSH